MAGALLRQPHGFEGIGAGSEPDRPRDESISHGPHAKYSLLKPCSAAPALTNVSRADNHLLAAIDDLIDLDAEELQLPKELPEGLQKTPVATVNLRIRQVRQIMPFQVRRKPREGSFRAIPVERVKSAPHELHVLVRNKRSPRLQRWFERNALSQTFELTNEAPG